MSLLIPFRPNYQSTNLSTPPATVITNDAYEMYHDDDILNTIQSTPWFDREYVKENRSLVSYLKLPCYLSNIRSI